MSALMVVDRGRRLQGVVYEADVARAIQAGSDTLHGLTQPVPTASEASLLAEIMTAAAESQAGVAVIDDEGRLTGVIPRVTLLNALADPDAPEHDSAGPPEEPSMTTEVVS